MRVATIVFWVSCALAAMVGLSEQNEKSRFNGLAPLASKRQSMHRFERHTPIAPVSIVTEELTRFKFFSKTILVFLLPGYVLI